MSNGKTKGHGNRKCANKYQCRAWIEAANFALRFSPAAKRWYERKAAKRILRKAGPERVRGLTETAKW